MEFEVQMSITRGKDHLGEVRAKFQTQKEAMAFVKAVNRMNADAAKSEAA